MPLLFYIAMLYPFNPASAARGSSRLHSSGKTLLELIVVITIIAILAGLMVPVISYFKRKAQNGACMSNLKSLHAGFAGYLLDHQMVWPQLPGNITEEGMSGENDQIAEFFIKAIEPYGAHRETWLCPSDRESFAESYDEKNYDASYIPTQFDNEPNAAYRYGTQPWLIERGGFHDQKINRIMPDASINPDSFPMPF